MGKTHGAPCLPVTREEWEEMRREPFLADLCRQIERGDEQLKHRLPVWTPHCAEFRGNHRAIADALNHFVQHPQDFAEGIREEKKKYSWAVMSQAILSLVKL